MSEADISAIINAYAQLNQTREQHPVCVEHCDVCSPALPAAATP